MSPLKLENDQGTGPVVQWPSGQDSVLPLQGARVRSLVREQGSHTLQGTARKKEKVIAENDQDSILIKETI